MHTITRTIAATLALGSALCAPQAAANLIKIIEEVTTTHSITVVTQTPKDSAEVEITGPGWSDSQSVFDGHPSIAEVTAPQSPWGGPYARGKAFGDGASGETWTAFMADANGPDTYRATILRATASKLVTVTNLTTTSRTVVVTLVFVPEFAAVAWDDGVLGDLGVVYRARLDGTDVVFEKNMMFSGSEIGQPAVIVDDVQWDAATDLFIPNLGPFDHAFVMDSTPFEIPVPIELGPNETRTITLDLDSEISTPDSSTTSGMGFFGATSNSIPLDLYEPNDTAETATPIACGDGRYEGIALPGDTDMFLLDAPFGSIVSVTMQSEQALTLDAVTIGGTPLATWPVEASDGTTRRYVSLGIGDLLIFESPITTAYTVFVTCRPPASPPMPGDLYGIAGRPDARELMRIDPLTGVAQFQAPLAGPFGGIDDIEFDLLRGQLFGLAGQAGELVNIDPMLGTVFPVCQLPPVGPFIEMAAGPDGLFGLWQDPNGQLILGDLQPQPDVNGLCIVTPIQSIPFIDLGGLAFDPANGLLYGCTGPLDPLGPQIIGMDPLSGQLLPPLQAPGFCGGLALQQQAILPNAVAGGATSLALVTAGDDPMPGLLFDVNTATGDATPLGDTGTGGMTALARLPGEAPVDSDGDGVVDVLDNCVATPNAAQNDADSDGIGNACDADLNQDCIVNASDLGLLRLVFFTNDAVADFNSDGVVNAIDLGILRTLFFLAPGPSGVPNACSS